MTDKQLVKYAFFLGVGSFFELLLALYLFFTAVGWGVVFFVTAYLSLVGVIHLLFKLYNRLVEKYNQDVPK